MYGLYVIFDNILYVMFDHIHVYIGGCIRQIMDIIEYYVSSSSSLLASRFAKHVYIYNLYIFGEYTLGVYRCKYVPRVYTCKYVCIFSEPMTRVHTHLRCVICAMCAGQPPIHIICNRLYVIFDNIHVYIGGCIR